MSKKNIYIISAGYGAKEAITKEALDCAADCHYLIGAKRFCELFPQQNYKVISKIVEETMEILEKDVENIVGVVVSGDAGFYSLSKKIVHRFKSRIIKIVPGISSMQAFMAKTMKTYENTLFFSLHGRNRTKFDKLPDRISICLKFNHNLYILCDSYVCALEILKKNPYLFDKFEIIYAANLGYDDEVIKKITSLKDFENERRDDILCALYLEVK